MIPTQSRCIDIWAHQATNMIAANYSTKPQETLPKGPSARIEGIYPKRITRPNV